MVQKYDMHSKDGTWDDNYEMRAEQHGDYVTLDDYAALESDYNILRRDYQSLVDKLGALYKES